MIETKRTKKIKLTRREMIDQLRDYWKHNIDDMGIDKLSEYARAIMVESSTEAARAISPPNSKRPNNGRHRSHRMDVTN
jgi:hypothetical protein